MGYSFVKQNDMRRWPCKEAWYQGPFNGCFLGSHVGRSLTGILNGPKSDRLLLLTSEARQSVIFKVDYVTVLNAVLWILKVLCIRFNHLVILVQPVQLLYMEIINVEEEQTLEMKDPGALFSPSPSWGM